MAARPHRGAPPFFLCMIREMLVERASFYGLYCALRCWLLHVKIRLSAPSNVANSTTGIVSLAPDAEALAPALYDASGRRVSAPVRHGVTIDSKGGKRVAKQ